jgi:hypothetical protein
LTESSGQGRANRKGVIVVVGYALWIVLALVACSAIYYFDNIQSSPGLKAQLPTATPAARITPGELSNADKIFEEHFVNSPNAWSAFQGSTQFSMRDGSLALKSLDAREFAAVDCIYCVSLLQPYYLQADLTTDAATPTTYGILFKLDLAYNGLFYAYLINAKSQEYFLYSLSGNTWALHTSGASDFIEPYPNSNTLGIFVRDDYLELYVNGNRIDTFQETNTSFQKGSFGFYINDAGPQLIVRDALIFAIK